MVLRWPRLSTGYGVWLHTFLLLLILNTLFLAVLFLTTLIPSGVIIERIQRAFDSGELVEEDYLWYDRHRGFHQYNDCNILQMITNPDPSAVGRGLGPWLYLDDSSATGVCRTLRELVVAGRDPDTLMASRYTRYWHGYIPVVSVMLFFLEISTARTVLHIAVYLAVLLLFLSGVREKRFFLLTGPVAFAGAFFWGLPYFGQGMSHAPGDAVVMLGLACLIFWHATLVQIDKLIPFCSLFGALTVYFTMLTGPLPVAAGLLFPTVYLLSRLTYKSRNQIGRHFELAIVALAAFALGAIFSLGARVVVAATLVQPSGLDVFAGNLDLYTQPLESRSYILGFLRPFGRLLRRGAILTYGSNWGLAGLYASVCLAWIVSTWLAWKRKSLQRWADLLAFIIGAVSIPVWTIILQTHTFMHADFMARILLVPISLSWAAMLWQLWFWHTAASKCNAVGFSHFTQSWRSST